MILASRGQDAATRKTPRDPSDALWRHATRRDTCSGHETRATKLCAPGSDMSLTCRESLRRHVSACWRGERDQRPLFEELLFHQTLTFSFALKKIVGLRVDYSSQQERCCGHRRISKSAICQERARVFVSGWGRQFSTKCLVWPMTDGIFTRSHSHTRSLVFGWGNEERRTTGLSPLTSTCFSSASRRLSLWTDLSSKTKIF